MAFLGFPICILGLYNRAPTPGHHRGTHVCCLLIKPRCRGAIYKPVMTYKPVVIYKPVMITSVLHR
jgi:hypothetical protein